MTEKIVNKGFKIRLYPTDEQKVIYVERLTKVALRVDSFDETVRCKATNTEAPTF